MDVSSFQESLLLTSLSAARSRISALHDLPKSLPSLPFDDQYFSPSSYAALFAERIPLRSPYRVSTSSNHIAISSLAGVVHLIDPASMTIHTNLTTLSHRNTVLNFLSPSTLCFGDSDGNLAVHALEDSTTTTNKPFSDSFVTSIHSILDHVLLTSSNGFLSIHAPDANSSIFERHVSRSKITTSSRHPDQSVAALASRGSISLWDLRNGNRVGLLPNSHPETCSSLDFHQNGFYLASGGTDNLINVYDIRKLEKVYEVFNHRRVISRVRWLDSPRPVLVSSCFEGNMVVRDVLLNRNLTEYQGHDGRVVDFDLINHSDLTMISIGSDGLYKFWGNVC
ncbi:hypothetical protein P9112_006868 [Eukaryota sp. TZLM1-RC]